MRKDVKRKINKVTNYSLAFSLVGTGVGGFNFFSNSNTYGISCKESWWGMLGRNKEWGVSFSG